MMIGTQEIITIMLVIGIVGFALFRRLYKKSDTTNACSGCDQTTANKTDEKTIHFFKKQD